jgi:hypothetical protein
MSSSASCQLQTQAFALAGHELRPRHVAQAAGNEDHRVIRFHKLPHVADTVDVGRSPQFETRLREQIARVRRSRERYRVDVLALERLVRRAKGEHQ